MAGSGAVVGAPPIPFGRIPVQATWDGSLGRAAAAMLYVIRLEIFFDTRRSGHLDMAPLGWAPLGWAVHQSRCCCLLGQMAGPGSAGKRLARACPACVKVSDRHMPIDACVFRAYMRIHAQAQDHIMPLAVLSALSEPTRLAAIRILADGGEHCV
ncbi:MAG: hypothetical protein ACK4RZ_13805, partial [Paracoccaceae bacterium]